MIAATGLANLPVCHKCADVNESAIHVDDVWRTYSENGSGLPRDLLKEVLTRILPGDAATEANRER